MEGQFKYKCRVCGEKGHNLRTCPKLVVAGCQAKVVKSRINRCKLCGVHGHNRKTCTIKSGKKEEATMGFEAIGAAGLKARAYTCRLCLERGHNSRTCPQRSQSNNLPKT